MTPFLELIPIYRKKIEKLKIMFYNFYTKLINMKTYKHLFNQGFTFNGKDYSLKSYIQNYYNLVQDILNGEHGKVPSPETLTNMFMSTVYTEYDNMPISVKTNKLYKELGDIYVLTNKDKHGLNMALKRISKHMNKEVDIRG